MGLRESVTPFSMIGWVFSAGWAQLINGSPNYGTNGKAFAAAPGSIGSAQLPAGRYSATPFWRLSSIRTPRYYQLGQGHKFFNRAIYAGTRPTHRQDRRRPHPSRTTPSSSVRREVSG